MSSHAPRGAGHRLVLMPEAGEEVVLDYTLADGLALPIDAGERVSLSAPLDGSGLAVREPDGTLRALVSIDGGFADEVGFTIEGAWSPPRLAYSEVLSTREGCLVSIEHVDLALRDAERVMYLAPGTTRSLSLVEVTDRPRLAPTNDAGEVAGARRYDLIALDASRPTTRRTAGAGDEDGRCPEPAHTSWVLMLTR